MPKKEWHSLDAQCAVLYGKKTDANDICYPIFVNEAGALQVSDQNGMVLPYHNSQVIDETDSNNVTITYKLDGTTVGTKTIAIVGSITTITIT